MLVATSGQTASAPFFGVLERYPGVFRQHTRWVLRALYECAGKVLPDCVINDIAEKIRARL